MVWYRVCTCMTEETVESKNDDDSDSKSHTDAGRNQGVMLSARALIQEALVRRSLDNITVAIIQL
jgi:hypothetical protein